MKSRMTRIKEKREKIWEEERWKKKEKKEGIKKGMPKMRQSLGKKN